MISLSIKVICIVQFLSKVKSRSILHLYSERLIEGNSNARF